MTGSGSGTPSDQVEIPVGCHDILTSKSIAFLATVKPNGLLSVTPVSPMFDGSTIRVSTTTDRFKYHNLREDARVTLCMAHPEDPRRYIEVRGHATLSFDTDRMLIDELARHHMGVERYPYDPQGTRRVTITIHPEQVSAPDVAKNLSTTTSPKDLD